MSAKFVIAAVFSSLVFGSWLKAEASADTRYGLFNLLDHRSKYGSNWFPEPLNSDENDVDQEFRLNYFHAEKHGFREHEASVEIEKSFGLLTLEVEVPYVYEEETEDGVTQSTDGLGAVELSARHPFFQYVSQNGFFDYTAGARIEVAIPTGSDVSKNTEFVGGVFQTIGLGDHFSIQNSVGYSTLFGPNDASGEQVLEYAAVFGYNFELEGKTLAMARITPIFEIDGETALNHADSGTTLLEGVLGVLINFDSIGIGQPKFMVGYVFPINDDARNEFDWGITTSLILEY
jgi:hypothetical protein